jgi:hypothetical protein
MSVAFMVGRPRVIPVNLAAALPPENKGFFEVGIDLFGSLLSPCRIGPYGKKRCTINLIG